jgi:phosphatidylinositol-3-phosphatase
VSFDSGQLAGRIRSGFVHGREVILARLRVSQAIGLLTAAPAQPKPGELPMPSPWAAGVALLALLGFGVFVGTTLTPAQQRATPLLLAAAPHTGANALAVPHKTPSTPASPPETSAETTPEAAPETTTTTVASEGAAANNRNTAPPSTGAAPSSPASELPPVQHVFLIVLSDEGENAAFGAGSQAPFLAKKLRDQGELIEGYYGIAGGELANGVGLISGQGPTPQTAEDCPLYSSLTPGTPGKLGQATGSGCVYPSATLTLADQLTDAGKTWRAYVEDIGNGGPGQPQTCRHPTLGAADSTHAPLAGDAYVTWRNPFVYFQSLTGGSSCASDDVGLEQLGVDLRTPAKTPSFAYIVPNRCHDGSPQPCAPGQPAGMPPADVFLHKVVPQIESSQAYKQGGLIAITFDQAPQSGAQADKSGCCMSAPTGGGKLGLLLISKYVKPGSFNATGEYNHFSLLRSIENLFGLQPLGYAGETGLLAFDKSVFNAGK